jgi:hypothetical protein
MSAHIIDTQLVPLRGGSEAAVYSPPVYCKHGRTFQLGEG